MKSLNIFYIIFFVFILSITFNSDLFSKSNENEHKVYNHHLGTFLGITTNTNNRNSDFTMGLEYEYKLPALEHVLGFGLFTEFVYAKESEYLLGVPIFYHLENGIKLFFAPGIAVSKEETLELNEITMEKAMKSKDITNFLIRFGASYDMHINRLSISPMLQLDYLDSHFSMVYGIGFGISM